MNQGYKYKAFVTALIYILVMNHYNII